MKKLAILGAGDLGQQIALHAWATGFYEPVAFFDDFGEVGQSVVGIPILGPIDSVFSFFQEGLFDCLVVGVGYNHLNFRESLFSRFREKISFATIIHPSAYVASSAEIGPGTVIYPKVVLDSGVTISENCILNVASVVAHDSSVGPTSFIAPSAAIAGFVKIAARNILGINCTVIDNLETIPDVRLAAGAVLTKKPTKTGLYAGVPAVWKKN